MSSAGTIPGIPRVLIVTATVGWGHNAAARAIISQLESAGRQIRVECVDVLSFTPRPFRACYAGSFALAMARLPWLYGLGFRLTNRPDGPSRALSERGRLWSERLAMKRFARYLLAQPADLVVHTHFLAAPLVGRLIEAGKLKSRQFVVVTDDEVHRFWYAENVEQWFVPAPCSAEKLRRWGIERQRITVSGVPIDPKWTGTTDREKVLSDWALPRNKSIVLLSGGTEFTCGPIVKIARRIVAACRDAYVVVLAGRNKKLLGRLSALPEAPDRLVGVGFTDRLDELVGACSMMVTKAGGLTTAECLAKGTPMVLLRPVPGHEAGNARYFQSEAAAVVTRNTNDVAQTVARLLREPRQLAHLAENARRLYRPASQTIANAICRAVSPQTAGCAEAQ